MLSVQMAAIYNCGPFDLGVTFGTDNAEECRSRRETKDTVKQSGGQPPPRSIKVAISHTPCSTVAVEQRRRPAPILPSSLRTTYLKWSTSHRSAGLLRSLLTPARRVPNWSHMFVQPRRIQCEALRDSTRLETLLHEVFEDHALPAHATHSTVGLLLDGQ